MHSLPGGEVHADIAAHLSIMARDVTPCTIKIQLAVSERSGQGPETTEVKFQWKCVGQVQLIVLVSIKLQ